MSRYVRALVLLPCLVTLAFLASCVATISEAPPPTPSPESRLTFYEVLSPYGEWFDVAPYGPVWRPYHDVVGPDFVPYDTGGRWVYSDSGWIFDTDWNWGWVPFHYGRWLNLGAVEGWVWVPGTVWGPAWVDWRVGGGYVSWAPLPPANVAVAVGVYQPLWIWVGTPYFQNGQHHGHVTFEPRGPPDSTVIPPRPRPDGHAWYSGPSPEWVSHGASAVVTPRHYVPPEPLPHGVLEMPKGSRMRPLPPPGHPAEEWSRSPEPPPPPGHEHGASRPPEGSEHGASQPPEGSEHGASQPHARHSEHGEEHPGRSGRGG